MEATMTEFLRDYIELLYSRAQEAQAECNGSRKTADVAKIEFACGRAVAYYEVVSLFVSQAETFGLSEQLDKLSNIRPDDLLK